MIIYKVTQKQLKALQEKGSIIVGGKTYYYDDDNYYHIVDPGYPEYNLEKDPDNSNGVVLKKDDTVISVVNLSDIDVAHANYSDHAADLYYTDDAGEGYYVHGKALVTSVDGKLDKIEGPFSGYDRLYAVSSNGVQYGVGYSSAIGKSTIVARNNTGEILVPTPTSDDGAVPKSYVDDALDAFTTGGIKVYSAIHDEAGNDIVATYATKTELSGKLDKVTTAGNNSRAYVVNKDGTQGVLGISDSNVANTVALRNTTGDVFVALTPGHLAAATSKNYVDSQISKVKITSVNLSEPDYYNNTTITTMPLINMSASDKFAMIPINSIIVEKSIDGGTTWTPCTSGSDTYNNQAKRSLFTGTHNRGFQFPKIDGKNSPLCMLRITISGMTYNVPEDTVETDKYAYWNKDNVKSNYRYCSINNVWFWVCSAENRINIKVEGATGAASNTWVEFGNIPTADGWNGADQCSINPARSFGGGIGQTSNYWNWRFTFRAVGKNGEIDGTNFTASTSNMSIISIKGFGKDVWTYGNDYLVGLNSVFRVRDADYSFDMQKGSYYPNGDATYDFGANSNKWRYIHAQNFSENGVLLVNKYAAKSSVDGKLDKVTDSGDNHRVYAVTSSGSQEMITASEDVRVGTIALRENHGQGALQVGTPSEDNHAATKKYVDDSIPDISGKLDKVTTESSSQRVYGINPSTGPGEPTQTTFVLDAVSATALSIPQRTDKGEIIVGEPTTNSSAVTRLYVDNAIKDKVGMATETFTLSAGESKTFTTSDLGKTRTVIEVIYTEAEQNTMQLELKKYTSSTASTSVYYSLGDNYQSYARLKIDNYKSGMTGVYWCVENEVISNVTLADNKIARNVFTTSVSLSKHIELKLADTNNTATVTFLVTKYN